jgi:hypothetical protein
MTKLELVDQVKAEKGPLVAQRIAGSPELCPLADAAPITSATVDKWIADSPRLNGNLYVERVPDYLSKSDVRLIGRILQHDKDKGDAEEEAKPERAPKRR